MQWQRLILVWDSPKSGFEGRAQHTLGVVLRGGTLRNSDPSLLESGCVPDREHRAQQTQGGVMHGQPLQHAEHPDPTLLVKESEQA